MLMVSHSGDIRGSPSQTDLVNYRADHSIALAVPQHLPTIPVCVLPRVPRVLGASLKLQPADLVAVDSSTVTSACGSGLVTVLQTSFICVFIFKDGTQIP